MEKIAEKRRIVLVPVSAQGHVTPMMQLGKVLHLKGFSITVVQSQSKQISSSSSQHFPGFHFVLLPESLPLSEAKRLGSVKFLMKLNETSEASFKDFISQLLLQQGNDIACIIYDKLMYFCEAAAKEFKIPSVIFTTTCATNHVCCCVLSKLNAEKFLIDMEDPEMQDKVVEELHPFLRYKNLPTSGFGPLEPLFESCREIVNKRTASAVIINTTSCLESSSLSWLQQELNIPVYPLGPLHIVASSSGPSLLEEDKSFLMGYPAWLYRRLGMDRIIARESE